MSGKLVAATSNPGKLREFRRILEPLGIQVISLGQLGREIDVVEDADTFEGNARKKAEAIYAATGLPTVSDDSGLCVDAMGGAPGVYSARFEGEDTPYDIKMGKILEKLTGLPKEKRSARFVCAICCVLGEGDRVEAKGICEGFIGEEIDGNHGFGYDPIFVEAQSGQSFGRLPDGEKDKKSHRGQALRRLRQLLEERLGQ